MYQKSIYEFPACSKVFNAPGVHARQFLAPSEQYTVSSVYANIKPSMCLAYCGVVGMHSPSGIALSCQNTNTRNIKAPISTQHDLVLVKP